MVGDQLQGMLKCSIEILKILQFSIIMCSFVGIAVVVFKRRTFVGRVEVQIASCFSKRRSSHSGPGCNTHRRPFGEENVFDVARCLKHRTSFCALRADQRRDFASAFPTILGACFIRVGFTVILLRYTRLA